MIPKPMLSLVGKKLNLGSLIAEFPGLLSLGHLAHLRADELTVEHLDAIASALKSPIPFNEELKTAAVEFLRGRDINAVCDLIQSPESVRDIVIFLKGGFSELKLNHVSGQNDGHIIDIDPLFIS